MAKIQSTEDIKPWGGRGAAGPSSTTGGIAKWSGLFGRQLGTFSQNSYCDAVTVLLVIHLRDLKTCQHENLHMDVYSSLIQNV
jgi:hypothetical protein